MTWLGADQVDVRWGQPIYVPLKAVLKTRSLGPIVKAWKKKSTFKYWVIRLDAGCGMPIEEDTRSLLAATSKNDQGIIDDMIDLLSEQVIAEGTTTATIRLVGSILVHTEM